DAWGGDDLMLDEEGNPDIDEDEMHSATSEKENKEGGWDVDDDLSLPPDVDIKSGGDDDDNFYTPPSRGQAPSVYWPNNSRLVADHVASGAFDSAARLLCDQFGITRIEPFKQLFLTVYARSRAAYEGLPSAGPNFVYRLRNWQDGSGRSGLPAVNLHLNDLAASLQTCYQLTTGGKFNEAVA
ncbi:unnamed protein product, partial [Cercopithifilaria johnstoni]